MSETNKEEPIGRKPSGNQELKTLESDYYYFNEEGLLVFTAKYHLKRGYCCGNGCRHCPYKTGERNQELGVSTDKDLE